MASNSGEKELKTKWPIITGLGSGDKHEGRSSKLVAEQTSNVPQRECVGL